MPRIIAFPPTSQSSSLDNIVFNGKPAPVQTDNNVIELGRLFVLRTNVKFIKTSQYYLAYTGKYGNIPIRKAKTALKLYNSMKSYIDATKSLNKDELIKCMRDILLKEDPSIPEYTKETADVRKLRLSIESYFRKNPDQFEVVIDGYTLIRT